MTILQQLILLHAPKGWFRAADIAIAIERKASAVGGASLVLAVHHGMLETNWAYQSRMESGTNYHRAFRINRKGRTYRRNLLKTTEPVSLHQ